MNSLYFNRRGLLLVLVGITGMGLAWKFGPSIGRERPEVNSIQTMRNGSVERTASELMRREGAWWDPTDNKPFTGWLIERYPDHQLQSRSALSNGILAGVSEGWNTNGVQQIREEFLAGLSEGPVVRWREDGTRLSEGVARAGKLEGQFRRWHPNGRLAEEVTLRRGEARGVSRAWFPGGNLKAEVRLNDGKVVAQQFWKDGEQDGATVGSVSTPAL